MKLFSLSIALVLCLSALADGPADNIPDKVRPVPPKGATISAEDRQELETGVVRLGKEIDSLRKDLNNKPAQLALLPDVQIFHNAVRYALRYDEIFNPTNEIPAAKAAIKMGLERVSQLRDGKAPWISATGLVVRGYVSKLDDSVQPYGLVIPVSYQPATAHRFRVDVWFHGRDEKLSELNFITQRQKSPGEFTPPNAIVLHTYSRFCNGQRFAGEIDAFEALESVRSRYPIDENRLIVRGFSLGGAACWHMAVHHAGLWAAAAPGAGFSETADFLKVFQNEPVQPTWYEQKLWHLYDATDYALNVFNCPTVAYSGEIDKQKQAADMMARSLTAEGMQLTHIIGPQTAHKYHPEAKEEINRRIDSIAALGRNPAPRSIRFTTWTLRYNQMDWVVVDGLEQHWERARVEAELDEPNNAVKIATTNVSELTLAFPAGTCPLDLIKAPIVQLDGRKVTATPVASDRSWAAHFKKEEAIGSVRQNLKTRDWLNDMVCRDRSMMRSWIAFSSCGLPGSR
jgi:pimeloyl-ACP methyl ester carboxylesterase